MDITPLTVFTFLPFKANVQHEVLNFPFYFPFTSFFTFLPFYFFTFLPFKDFYFRNLHVLLPYS
jgi:hypothetical protein